MPSVQTIKYTRNSICFVQWSFSARNFRHAIVKAGDRISRLSAAVARAWWSSHKPFFTYSWQEQDNHPKLNLSTDQQHHGLRTKLKSKWVGWAPTSAGNKCPTKWHRVEPLQKTERHWSKRARTFITPYVLVSFCRPSSVRKDYTYYYFFSYTPGTQFPKALRQRI